MSVDARAEWRGLALIPYARGVRIARGRLEGDQFAVVSVKAPGGEWFETRRRFELGDVLVFFKQHVARSEPFIIEPGRGDAARARVAWLQGERSKP